MKVVKCDARVITKNEVDDLVYQRLKQEYLINFEQEVTEETFNEMVNKWDETEWK